MATTVSTKSPFEILYGEKLNIIGSFSEFGRIAYVTKKENVKKYINYKTYKAIMVVYADNRARDTYKLCIPDTNSIIISRDIKWEGQITINPE